MQRLSLISALASLLTGCLASHHAVQPSALGRRAQASDLAALIDVPGPLELETINSTDWAVDRAGLVNLDHPRARAAGLRATEEQIQIYFHVLRHPTRGTFIVDTGVERALRDHPDRAAIRGLVARVMKTESMKVHRALGDWLADEPTPLAGVFLTHLHLDHVSGLPDVPKGTPIYAGPGEVESRALLNAFTQASIDRALDGHAPLSEWGFVAGPAQAVVDVFGDGSLFALWVPGHTPGSTAYLARTSQGPVLLVGDASHTVWGWDHDVEPGTFSRDVKQSAVSLARLRQLVAAHPRIDVRLGHQARPTAPSSVASH